MTLSNITCYLMITIVILGINNLKILNSNPSNNLKKVIELINFIFE